MLGDFVKVAVEIREFRLHHVSACGPPAGHQDDGLVLDIVHAKTDVPQLLQHTLITHNRDSFCVLHVIRCSLSEQSKLETS